MIGVNTSNYKIVDTRQFVYTADTSRRGDKIAMAFNEDKPCIVSSIYTVFEVIDESVLLPEYLFLWFNRPEFDRDEVYKEIFEQAENFKKYQNEAKG